ncbi:hypothetical protein PsorP6_007271 [Peronosclerospora sorghi]|uniref:Uncharacterized protein n=1 Tax=Peronosclerospora sorghi TaxID=230839 RepID=A0ACC0W849_9STRA|nr:hypothetical protein PsorP6_007271 [Peronosclerospora sorghi]
MSYPSIYEIADILFNEDKCIEFLIEKELYAYHLEKNLDHSQADFISNRISITFTEAIEQLGNELLVLQLHHTAVSVIVQLHTQNESSIIK